MACLFWTIFIDILNDHQEKLSKTLLETKIKLIPKNNKAIKGINGLIAISLTNFDFIKITF